MASTAALVAILDHLNGPRITTKDIDWVADLPAGKGLLDFLASQIQSSDVASCLNDIALCKAEVELWDNALQAKLVTLDSPSPTVVNKPTLPSTPFDYLSPLIIRSQLDGIEEQQLLLDHQLKIFDNRVSKSRSTIGAEQRRSKGVFAAQNQASSTSSSIKERLSQLSYKADSSLISVVQCVSQLVSDISVIGTKDNRNVHRRINELSPLLDVFSTISYDVARISLERSQSDPSDPLDVSQVESLRSEVQHLAASIREFENGHVGAALEERCEGEDWTEYMRSHDRSSIDQDYRWVEETVQQTWNREVAADLQSSTDGFRQVADLLEDELLPPLVLTCAALSILDTSLEEAHIAIQALVDEMDDIQADLCATEDSHVFVKQSQRETLEERAKALLKHLRGSRPGDLSSLVLVARPDVLSELSDVRVRFDRANDEVATLCLGASQDLKLLDSHTQIYLSTLTTHSPLTTAPPIALSREVENQITIAQVQIAQVSNVLDTLPGDFLLDSRARRKLDSFIEKHG